MSILLLRSRISSDWQPLRPFMIEISVLKWRVSILLEFKAKTVRFGRYPSILTLWNSLELKSNSFNFGNFCELNVSSKSFNLHPVRLISKIYSVDLPFNLSFSISLVNLPVKCYLACWCSGLSIDIPSKTFNFLRRYRV